MSSVLVIVGAVGLVFLADGGGGVVIVAVVEHQPPRCRRHADGERIAVGVKIRAGLVKDLPVVELHEHILVLHIGAEDLDAALVRLLVYPRVDLDGVLGVIAELEVRPAPAHRGVHGPRGDSPPGTGGRRARQISRLA